MPVSCLLLDPALVIVAVSDRYLRDTMTRRADLLGTDIFAVFPENPDDPLGGAEANARNSFDRVRLSLAPDTMPTLKYDIRRPAAEGGGFEVRYWSVVNAPLLGPGGTLAYIVHRAEDITEYVRLTEQKRELTAELRTRTGRMEAEILARSRDLENANRALRQLAVTFERQVEGAPDATVVVDRSGAIVLVNRKAEEMFGYPRQELAGAPFETLVPESSRDVHVKHRAAYAADSQMRAMGRGLDLNPSGRRRDGTQFPVSVALYCADPEQGLVVASVRDITAQQETEAEHRRLSRNRRARRGCDLHRHRRRGHHVVEPWGGTPVRLLRTGDHRPAGNPAGPAGARRRAAQPYPQNLQDGPDRAHGDHPGP